MNFFFGSMYWMIELTSLGFLAVLIALTITVAAAVPSMFRAVPTIVWSALKLMAASARSDEYRTPTPIANSNTNIM